MDRARPGGRGQHTARLLAVDHPFRPSTLTIDGVLTPTTVIGRGQNRHGVPKAPPLTGRGKRRLAWDKASGVRPGGTAGVVRLTAHTYDHLASDGEAKANGARRPAAAAPACASAPD